MPGDVTTKTYSYDELKTLAMDAGFTGKDVDIAAAVAVAESGGRSHAYNPVGKDDSYGLWQINMKGKLGPERRKRFGIAKNSDLFDPGINARAAKTIKDESGWDAWTTYKNGKYLKYVDGKSSTPESKPSVDDGSLIGGIKASFNAIGENLMKTGANIGGILIGITFIVLGIVLLARKQVTNVVPIKGIAGKVLKGVK